MIKKRWLKIIILLFVIIGAITIVFFVISGKKTSNNDSSGGETQMSESANEKNNEKTELIEIKKNDNKITENNKENSSNETKPKTEIQPKVANQSDLLILVNRDNPLTKNYKVTTEKYMEKDVDVRVLPSLKKVINAAKSEGIQATICSAYRTLAYQQSLIDRDVNNFMKKGMTKEQSLVETYKSLAIPGTSEHNSGLAIDFYTSKTGLTNAFADTKIGKWLLTNAHKFGFILRYPKDKVAITKISYEPWHYRYVGEENALKIKNSGLCLEEFLKAN